MSRVRASIADHRQGGLGVLGEGGSASFPLAPSGVIFVGTKTSGGDPQ
jgi:hypothetical protein